jgi:CSLREA domain-containing protein
MMIKNYQRIAISLILLAILFGGMLFFPRDVHASIITVETNTDELDGAPGNGDCSLREAISNANNDNDAQADCNAGSGNDLIVLPDGIYTLTGSSGDDLNLSGDLDVWDDLTITGVGSGITIIQAGTSSPVTGTCGNCVDRVFHIQADVDVSIYGVMIRYGKGSDGLSEFGTGSSGGGIYNQGTLRLENCVVTHNRSGDGFDNPSGNGGFAGSGGGIYTEGSLTLTNSWVTNNRAGDGGNGSNGGSGQFGGYGGGIYAILNQTVTLNNVLIGQNSTGNGGDGGDAASGNAGVGNQGGAGGGLFCYNCTLTMVNSSLILNRTGDGGDGGDAAGEAGNGGNGGYGGYGAGAYLSEAATTANLVATRIHQNQTGLGGLAGSGSVSGSNGSNGKRGIGGGLYNSQDSQTTITFSTISDNSASDGGGILTSSGADTVIYNSTISGNMADGSGGGISEKSQATMALTFVTIAYNISDNDGDGTGDGGGIQNTDAITISNTIIANNYSVSFDNHDCKGTITSLDYNLLGIGNSSYCYFTPQAHDLVGTSASPLDPEISPLAENGGPTQTHALDSNSPAIDQVPYGVNGCYTEIKYDQRGVIRYAPCDIGAFEIDQAFYVYLPLALRDD